MTFAGPRVAPERLISLTDGPGTNAGTCIGAARMTKQGKPSEKPESHGRIEVPSEPVNPELLPGNVDQAEAESMLAGMSVQWVNAPDLYQFPAHIRDLVNCARNCDSWMLVKPAKDSDSWQSAIEVGGYWRVDQFVRQHPRGQRKSLVDDLRAIADAQIRQYAKTCAKNKETMDSAAAAYLAQYPSPLRRSRGRKASERTAYETLKLAAKVKLLIEAGKSVEDACELGDPDNPTASSARKAYYAFKDAPEIDLMAALLRAGVESF